MEIEIRPILPTDIPGIHYIYRESVLQDTASWELEPPTEAEMRGRIESVLQQKYPFLVAVARTATGGNEIAGYSYASSYRPRPGYRYTVEDSIYVSPAFQRRGLAEQLLTRVIDLCTDAGYRQMVAVIGGSERTASIKLHEKLGFRHVGLLPSLGYKHDRWLDSVLMQRALGLGDSTLPTIAQPGITHAGANHP